MLDNSSSNTVQISPIDSTSNLDTTKSGTPASTPTAKHNLLIVSNENSSTKNVIAKRYCFGKMKKVQYIIFVVLTSLVVLIALLFGITYLAILPKLLPKMFWDIVFGVGVGGVTIEEVRWKNETDNGVFLKLYAYDEQLQLPVSFLYAEMEKPKFVFKTRENGKAFLVLDLNDNMFINGKDTTVFDLPNFGLLFPDPENSKDFVNAIANWIFEGNQSSPLKNPQQIEIECVANVWFLGIPLSNVNFAYTHDFEFGVVKSRIGELILSQLISAPAFNQNEGAFGGMPQLNAENSPVFDNGTVFGPLKIQKIAAIIDSSGLSLSASSLVTSQRQPFDVKIKELGLSLQVDNTDIAKFLATDVELEKDTKTIKLQVGLYPDIKPLEVPAIVKIVEKITLGGNLESFIGIRNVTLLIKDSTHNWIQKLFGGIDISMPLANLISLDSTSPSSPSTMMGSLTSLFAVKDLKIDFQSNDTIKISSNLTLHNPIDANITLAPLSASFSNDTGSKLLDASLTAINLSGLRANSISPEIIIKLQNSDLASKSFGKLVRDVFEFKESMISIGPISIDTAGDSTLSNMNSTNVALSLLRLRIPLNKLLFGSSGPLINIAPARLLADEKSLPPQIEWSLLNGALAAEGDRFSLNVISKLVSQFPLTASLPYIAARLGIDAIDAVKLELLNLGIKPGSQDINNTLSASFGTDPQLPTILGGFANSVIQKTDVTSNIVLQGLRLGPTKDSSYSLFDQINIVVPGKIVVGLLFPPPMPADATPADPTKAQLFKINLPPSLSTFSLNSLNPVVQSLDLATIPQSGLQAGISIGVLNTLPLSLDVPYIEFSLTANSDQLVKLVIEGVKATTGQNTIPTKLSVFFSESIAGEKLVSGLISGSGLGDFNLGLSGIFVGLSADKSIRALSGISIPIPSTGGASLELSKIVPWLSGISFSSFGFGLSGIDVATIGGGLRLSAKVGLTNPLPATLNVGFLSAKIMLSQTQFSEVLISNVVVVREKQDVALSVDLILGRDSSLKSKVASAFNDVKDGKPLSIEIQEIIVGSTSTDNIKLFKSIKLPLVIPPLISGTEGTGSVAPAFALTQLSLATIETGFFADVGVKIGGSSFSLTGSIGVASLDVFLENSKLGKLLLVSGKTENEALRLPLSLDLASSASSIPSIIAKIVNPLLNSSPSSPFKVGLTNLFFGTADGAQVPFDLLSAIKLDFMLDLSTLSTGGSNLLPAISLAGVDVQTSDSGFNVLIQAKLSSELLTKFQLSVGYLSANAFVESGGLALKLATISASNFNSNSGGQNSTVVSLPLGLDYSSHDSKVPYLVAKLLDGFFKGLPLPELAAIISGISFGSDANHKLDILGEIKAVFKLSSLQQSLAPSFSISPKKLVGAFIDKTTLSLDIGLAANLGLPFPLTAKAGYIGFDLTLNKLNFGIVSFSSTEFVNGLLSSHVEVEFSNDPKVIKEFMGWFTCILQAGCLTHQIKLQNFYLGSSKAQAIDILSRFEYLFVLNVPLSSVSKNGRVLDRVIAEGTKGLDSLFQIGDGDVNLNAKGLLLDFGLMINTSFELDVKIGHFKLEVDAVDYGFDEGDPITVISNLLTLESSNIRVSNSAQGKISLGLELNSSPEDFQVILNALMTPGVYVSATYALYGLEVGSSKMSPIKILSGIPLPVAVIQLVLESLPGGGGFSLPFSIGKVDTNTIDIGTDETQPIYGSIEIPIINNSSLSISTEGLFGIGLKNSTTPLISLYANNKGKTNILLPRRKPTTFLVSFDKGNLDFVQAVVNVALGMGGTWGEVLLPVLLDSPYIEKSSWLGDNLGGWTFALKRLFPSSVPAISISSSGKRVLEQVSNRLSNI